MAADVVFTGAVEKRSLCRDLFCQRARIPHGMVRDRDLSLETPPGPYSTHLTISRRSATRPILCFPIPLRRVSARIPPTIRQRFRTFTCSFRSSIHVFQIWLQKITAGSLTAYDKTAAIETYLRSHYSYTLNLTGKQELKTRSPISCSKAITGHCEYFASAMAILTRTLGIPTREINGFLPGEYNDLGNDYIVRGSDAHSWVESLFSRGLAG